MSRFGRLRAVLLAGTIVAAFGLGAPAAMAQQSCGSQALDYMVALANQQAILSPTQFPPQPGWRYFMHPAQPAIMFSYPPDWQLSMINQGYTVGATVQSPDGRFGFQIVSSPPNGVMSSQQAAEGAVQNLIGRSGQPRIICRTDVTVNYGMRTDVTFLAATDGATTAAVTAQAIYQGGPYPAWFDVRLAVAPADQIDAMLTQVYLPIVNQIHNVSGGPGGGGEEGGGGGGGGGDDDDDDDDDN